MIPLVDLKAQYNNIKDEIDDAVIRTLGSTQYILGDEVAAFEEEFSAYCGGAKHTVALNTGTSALHLALLAGEIGPGDEVITVAHTFVATVAAIVYSGARPVFVDIDPKSFTMDPALLEDAITERTRAIIPVHLYGQPADMDPILEIAKKRKLIVIEDAAQAHGAEYKGKKAGTIADIGCFSFYPGKNLGACGEGGAAVTNNSEYAHTMQMLRNWGQEKKYHHVLKGYNYRMDGIQGAVLRVKLRHLQKWTDARRKVADLYSKALSHGDIKTPQVMPYASHVFHIYGIRTRNRDHLQKALLDKGIHSGVHYPIPVHLLPAYKDLGYKKGDFPCTEVAANEELSLPIYPEITAEQIEFISNTVLEGEKVASF